MSTTDNQEKALRVTIDLDASRKERVRKHQERLAKSTPSGLRVTTADAIRNLIDRGLSGAERDAERTR